MNKKKTSKYFSSANFDFSAVFCFLFGSCSAAASSRLAPSIMQSTWHTRVSPDRSRRLFASSAEKTQDFVHFCFVYYFTGRTFKKHTNQNFEFHSIAKTTKNSEFLKAMKWAAHPLRGGAPLEGRRTPLRGCAPPEGRRTP